MSNGTTDTKKDRWDKWSAVAEIIGQLLIPIIAVFLAWYLPYYQDRQKEINVELKAMDIFYKDIGSSDSTQQNTAAGILKMVKPNFAAKLIKTLSGVN
jgi:competence protein ComGF